MVGDNKSQTVFFEFNLTEKKYYFIHVGGEQISFTVQDVKSDSAEETVKDLFSQAFNKKMHLLSPVNFTIIDGVFHRIRTTSSEVHENRNFHPKVPGKTDYLMGRIAGASICDNFIRDTFDNLRRTRFNY